jgi:hypothetical protein
MSIVCGVRRGNRALIVLVTSAALACSRGHAGSLPTEPPSTSPPTSASPTAATDFDRELRDAIATYYAALSAAAHEPKSKTDALARLIAPSCTCAAVIDALRKEVAAGRWLDYSYTATHISVIEVGPLGGNAAYIVVQSPGHERSADGSVVATFNGSSEKFSVHFARTSSGWLLDRANRVR